jgi:hypothetical protein
MIRVRPYLGMYLQPVTSDLAAALHLPASTSHHATDVLSMRASGRGAPARSQ